MNKFLKFLIDSPVVYYIYNRGSIIYGLNTKESDIDYLVVVDESFEVSEEFEQYKYENNRFSQLPYNILYENCDFIFFTTKQWFDQVTMDKITAWECACLPKKFVIKEHVKLLLKTNPLQLRTDCDLYLELYYSVAQRLFTDRKYHEWKKHLWDIIRLIKFSNQIIENHKIVNFKEANSDYEQLVNNDCTDEEAVIELWVNLLKEPLNILHKATDGILAKEKQKKIIQNG